MAPELELNWDSMRKVNTTQQTMEKWNDALVSLKRLKARDKTKDQGRNDDQRKKGKNEIEDGRA